jgi:ABC-type transport system involved in multi-copper enzyme maturation permease subunit
MSMAHVASLDVMRITAAHTVKAALRDRTIILLAAMFIVMVLISAYLGWSATNTVNHIYDAAVPVMKAQGMAIPNNPVGEMPPLSLFRNMVTYVALLGALAALVLGYQTAAADRKSGVIPLIFTRPAERSSVAYGKILAIAVSIVSVLIIAAIINCLTMLLLPGLVVDGNVLAGLAKFYAVSALYMMAFALIGAISASIYESESMALLVPVTIWLALTFIVPQVTGNIGPMAALNPLSTNIVAPTGPFFAVTSAVLGPLSIAESYRYLAASILDILSAAGVSVTQFSAALSLIIANIILAIGFVYSFKKIDACRSEYRD